MDIEIRFIGKDDIVATTMTPPIQRFSLQEMLFLVSDEIDREWWLDIAAAAWDAKKPRPR